MIVKWLCVILLAAVSCTGCRSMRLPVVNTSDPGWTVRQGQALWSPGRERPEIAGEVLLATREGQAFLQFTKNPLPFVTAQTSNEVWSVEFVPQKKRFSGKGTPTPRLVWVHLARGLSRSPVEPPLRFEQNAGGGWTLTNDHTGETITGFLNP